MNPLNSKTDWGKVANPHKRLKTTPNSTTATATVAATTTVASSIFQPTGLDNFFAYINIPKISITMFSFLDIKQISKWDEALEKDTVSCSKSNRDLLKSWIRGHSTQQPVFSLQNFVWSPIVTGQLNALVAFDHDIRYDRYVKFNVIISTLGERLESLNLDVPPPKDTEKLALEAFIKKISLSLNCAGNKCNNLVSIIFPIKTRALRNSTEIVKAFSSNVAKWPKLSHIALAVPYAEELDSTQIPSVTSLELDNSADNAFKVGLLSKIAAKFPNLTDMKMIKCDDDNVLKELAACNKLQHLYLDNSKYQLIPNLDLSLYQIITQCPLRTLRLIDVECTPIVLGAKNLVKAHLEIGNLGCDVTPELLAIFFAANSNLKEFNSGNSVCDHLFDVLFKFVKGNKTLNRLRVAFGRSEDPLPMQNLMNFIKHAAHIRSVTIDLKNMVEFPESIAEQVKSTHPNVKLLLE